MEDWCVLLETLLKQRSILDRKGVNMLRVVAELLVPPMIIFAGFIVAAVNVTRKGNKRGWIESLTVGGLMLMGLGLFYGLSAVLVTSLRSKGYSLSQVVDIIAGAPWGWSFTLMVLNSIPYTLYAGFFIIYGVVRYFEDA
ncbi:hypothetical protein KC980_04110 [candidate division WWE3 bacterium]|uniref:Uncharacterized protein n=1 Tax=candidate division WWE3 bacterium TaxID=2053526 RepID=A0A955J2A1_UNCKA|nr:hypothetical protein [candidate division WWE3 bacterium]